MKNMKVNVVRAMFDSKELDTKITAHNIKRWLLSTGTFDRYGNLAITPAGVPR